MNTFDHLERFENDTSNMTSRPARAEREAELRLADKIRDALSISSPLVQEELIADHYVAQAQLAMQLKQLIKLRKREGTGDFDEVIRYGVAQIKQAHLRDFGIPLEWPDVTSPTSF